MSLRLLPYNGHVPAKQGSAIFTVLGDEKVLDRSRILRAGQSETLKVEVSKVRELKLTTIGGEGYIHNSWAIWAQPTVAR